VSDTGGKEKALMLRGYNTEKKLLWRKKTGIVHKTMDADSTEQASETEKAILWL